MRKKTFQLYELLSNKIFHSIVLTRTPVIQLQVVQALLSLYSGALTYHFLLKDASL